MMSAFKSPFWKRAMFSRLPSPWANPMLLPEMRNSLARCSTALARARKRRPSCDDGSGLRAHAVCRVGKHTAWPTIFMSASFPSTVSGVLLGQCRQLARSHRVPHDKRYIQRLRAVRSATPESWPKPEQSPATSGCSCSRQAVITGNQDSLELGKNLFIWAEIGVCISEQQSNNANNSCASGLEAIL